MSAILFRPRCVIKEHYSDVTMSAIASQITGVTIVYSTVCSGADQRIHQSSSSLAFVRGIHRSPVTSPHKGPVTRKMFPFDDATMIFPRRTAPYPSSLYLVTCNNQLPSLVAHCTNCQILSEGSDRQIAGYTKEREGIGLSQTRAVIPPP